MIPFRYFILVHSVVFVLLHPRIDFMLLLFLAYVVEMSKFQQMSNASVKILLPKKSTHVQWLTIVIDYLAMV